MSENPLISIIINTYNGEKYLSKAIESVLAQSYSTWELIVWDNNSTDGTGDLVRSFPDDRIVYYTSDITTPLGEARNSAIQRAKGVFLSFLDSDDWWDVNRIARILPHFEDKSVGAVYTNGYKYFESTGRLRPFYRRDQKGGYLFESLIKNYNVYLPSIMFRKSALESLEYKFNPIFNMIEEADLLIRLSAKWNIHYCNEKLCFWRAHSSSLSWASQSKFAVENLVLIDRLKTEFPYLNGTKSLKRLEARTKYRIFIDTWKGQNVVNRHILVPHLLDDHRLIVFFILSFLPLKVTLTFLKILGKEL